MKRWMAGLLICLIPLTVSALQPVQTSPSLTEEQAEMELLRQLATGGRRAHSVDTILDIAGHPSLGSETAKVVVLEFGDFQCPFCRRHLSQSMPQILRAFVETGLVQYLFWDFPVEERHPRAFQAAIAARCADEQQRYWEMRKRLYLSPAQLEDEHLFEHATSIGLDQAEFGDCLDSGRYRDQIQRDQQRGLSLHVRGTPTFFLGLRQAGSKEVRLTRSIVGAQPIEHFSKAIGALLGSGDQKSMTSE